MRSYLHPVRFFQCMWQPILHSLYVKVLIYKSSSKEVWGLLVISSSQCVEAVETEDMLTISTPNRCILTLINH